MSVDNENKSAREGKTVRIEHVVPDDIRTAFTNHLVVQRSDKGEFTVSFFEINNPVLLSGAEGVEECFEKIESVEARCMARVVISGERMPNFIGALIQNYEEFEKERQSDKPPTVETGEKKNAG